MVRTGSQGQSTASESQFGPDLVRTGSLVVRTGSKWSELARSELARADENEQKVRRFHDFRPPVGHGFGDLGTNVDPNG